MHFSPEVLIVLGPLFAAAIAGLLQRYIGEKVAMAITTGAVGLSLALSWPIFIGFVWAPSWPLAIAFLALPTGLNYFYLSPAVTLVQEEVRPNQRVLAGALLLLVMNLIGLGLGPTYLGAVSDYFRPTHPDNSLQLAFYTLVPFYALAIAAFLWLARALKREAASRRQP